MDWQRLERWVTIALYIAAGVGLIVLLAKNLLPADSRLQQAARGIAGNLSELGNIASGTLIIIVLLVLGGTGVMALIFKGADLYREWRDRDKKVRAEAEAEGRAAEREAIREQLREQGINLDDLMPPAKKE